MEIIAHRGASREQPENTLAAFRRARELGADGVELDVHRTADGAIVVHHDAVIPGVGAIARLTRGELRQVRISPNATRPPRGPVMGGAPGTGEPLPELAEVIA